MAVRALLLVALLAARASAQPAERTTVEGELPPGLAGRWLVVEQQRLRTGLLFPFARLWEIRESPGGVELVLAHRRMPVRVASEVADAGSAGRPWTPRDADLHELADRWDHLPSDDSDGATIAHRITAAAGGLAIATEERAPGSSRVPDVRRAYTVRSAAPGRLAGIFASESTVSTPDPVPIAFRGDFQAYRLPAVPRPSPLRRLLDALVGRNEPS